MGWNVSMSVIKHPAPLDLPGHLGLSPELEPRTLSFYEAVSRDYTGHALAQTRGLYLVVHQFWWDFDWSDLTEAELAMSFFLSENRGGANTFTIWEYGERVRHWEEADPTWPARHPLERGLPYEVHPADYVSDVAARLIGFRVPFQGPDDDLTWVSYREPR